MADYYGTLAAARCLGAHGVPVTMAEWRLLAPARWSRHVTRHVTCPDPASPERFMDWLFDFGRRNPGHVLYPTSDDLAWLFATHRSALASSFRLFQPGAGPLEALLDKPRLHAACAEVGLEVPRTWLPTSRDEVERVAHEAELPVLIKPRTQVQLPSHTKGVQVSRRSALAGAFLEFARRHRHSAPVFAQDPAATWPMVQAYHPEARDSIYSLGGFVDESGQLFVARAARKVLQRPRRLGIGLCFEEAAPIPEISEKIAALCRRAGYHGVFEVELIESARQLLLIDFNPRFYSQLAFEVARRLPLPLLVYEAALGNTGAVRAVADQTSASTHGAATARFTCSRPATLWATPCCASESATACRPGTSSTTCALPRGQRACSPSACARSTGRGPRPPTSRRPRRAPPRPCGRSGSSPGTAAGGSCSERAAWARAE